MAGKKFHLLLSVIATALLFSSNASLAQIPEMLWQASYNGALNGKDVANYIITDTSGNVYVTGRSFENFSGGDFTTIKYNSDGIQLWTDHYSNVQSGYTNYGRRLITDKWQNVYAVGTTALHDGDLAVCKYSSSGRIWCKNFEPYFFSTYDDFGIDLDVDSTGYFYAMAMVTSPDGNLFDMYIIKCDSGGTKIWDENYTGASDADYPVDIEVTPGGTVYTLLQQFNFFGSQSRDISTFQYSGNGVQNWFSNYNGPAGGEDYPTSLELDENENQYVCGTTDAGSDDDMVIIKQNSFGTRLWTYTYNGSADGNDTAFGFVPLPNSLAAAMGKSKEIIKGSITDAIVTMVIDNGTIVWMDKFYGSDSLGASPSQLITDAFGNLYICGFERLTGGTTNSCIIKYDINGNLNTTISYDGGTELNDKFNSITLDKDNNILVAGQSFTSALNSNYVIVKYGNIPTGIASGSSVVKDFDLEQNYPNPFNPATTIRYRVPEADFVSLQVFDILGKRVAVLVNEEKPSGSYKINFNAEDLASGIYLYKLEIGSHIKTKKMVLTK